jgi:flavin reductase
VLICAISGSQGSEAIQRNGVFAVNVLGAEQEPLSRYFASRDRPRGVEGFSQIPHRQGVTGSPILEGVAAHLDCRLVASRDAGDHVVFVGEVLALESNPDVQPLLFHAGRYRHLSEE